MVATGLAVVITSAGGRGIWEQNGVFPLVLGKMLYCSQIPLPPVTFLLSYLGLTLSVTQLAFALTSDRLLCYFGTYVSLIGPHPSNYAHVLSACYYFLLAIFLPALSLWSFLPASRVGHETSHSFLTLCFFKY